MLRNDPNLSAPITTALRKTRIYGELEHKPFDCELLTRFATAVHGRGPVCDMGGAVRDMWRAFCGVLARKSSVWTFLRKW